MSHEPTHRIIRLKRYEQPPEGYFDNFLKEFHHRQRAELLKPSLSALLMERLSAFLAEVRVPAVAYAGATAVAAVAAVIIVRQPAPQASPAAYAASYSQTPVTIPKMQPVSLRVDTPNRSSGAVQLAPSYILRARPASHESPISF